MNKTRVSPYLWNYLVAALLGLAATQARALSEHEIIERIQALDWQTEPGNYPLTGTNASVTTTADEILVTGEDAREYMRLAEGHGNFQPDAVIVRVAGPDQNTQIVYAHHDIGHVAMDDWEEYIDKDQLLDQIKRGTQAANKIREAGYPSLYVDAWAQEPFLDRRNATAFWAISGHDSDGKSFINADALKLGRKGFTEVGWMGNPGQFFNVETSLWPALAAYEYDEGSKYSDFIPGTDTVAAAGVGALAYKLITGKAPAKAGNGVLAWLAIVAEKSWIIIVVLPFIFFWKRITRFFTGTKGRG